MFANETVGLRFKSQAVQFDFSVPTARLLGNTHFFEKSCVTRRYNDAEIGPANSLFTLA